MAENKKVDSLIELSIQLIRNHKISKAMSLLSKALKAEPRNLQAINLLGDCLFKIGQFTKAADTWKKVLKYDQNNHNAREKLQQFGRPSFQYWLKRYNQAEKLIKSRQYVKAKIILHQLLMEYDGFVKVYERLGLCYWEDSQDSMALRIWEKGLMIDHNNILITKYLNNAIVLRLKEISDAADPIISE